MTGIMPYIAIHHHRLTGRQHNRAYILGTGRIVATRSRDTENHGFCMQKMASCV